MPEIFLPVALKAAKLSGEILMRHYQSVLSITEKTPGDIVTNADFESEKAIIGEIKRSFPDHNFLSEESGSENRNSEYTWIIDPLDGTKNYARGFPFFCVSIALAKGDEVILGVVFAPFGKELFTAEKGKGAFLNGKRISCSQTKTVHDSYVAYCDGNGMENRLFTLNLLNAFKRDAFEVRKFGSAALELCYQACGRIDGFIAVGAKAWDWSAGGLLIEEAGGKISDLQGKPWNIHSKNLIAGNKYIHAELVKRLLEIQKQK
ncbi:Fructose-1,6-bisphosphatase/inositol-1-monophosphatase [Candidatus Gugararchaeum adminiculabundum]|nr:Fructose-1,6-bisphosphatase/inositol-1-monophosphatase [Candidatus Gugararchaeum adminiculabundum]